MGLDNLKDGIINTVKAHPVGTAFGAAGVATGAVLGTAAIIGAVKRRKSKRSKSRSTRKKRRRIKHTRRGWRMDRRRFNKRQKWEVAYRKRKKKRGKKMRSKKGIHYTKKGQPYKIMANGRARFIKKTKRRSR